MTKIYEQLHLSAEAGPELRVKALFCTGFVPNAEATTKYGLLDFPASFLQEVPFFLFFFDLDLVLTML